MKHPRRSVLEVTRLAFWHSGAADAGAAVHVVRDSIKQRDDWQKAAAKNSNKRAVFGSMEIEPNCGTRGQAKEARARRAYRLREINYRISINLVVAHRIGAAMAKSARRRLRK